MRVRQRGSQHALKTFFDACVSRTFANTGAIVIPSIERHSRFGRETRLRRAPIVTNYSRSDVVEAIVSHALPDWGWCAKNWRGYDFRHRGVAEHEIRLDVKQTSALQSWEWKSPCKPKWDIAPRKGSWEGSDWTERAGRNADIYIFATHAELNIDIADHRDPAQ